MPNSIAASFRPLTLGDKCRIVADLFDQGREGDAYSALEYILKMRGWPDWLKSVCADIDGRKAS